MKTMPVVNLNCRKCDKATTEYAKNKWRCLHCGAKYRYEKPQPLAAVPSVTINKNGRNPIKNILYVGDGIKVTPSMISVEKKLGTTAVQSTPVSAVVGIETEKFGMTGLQQEMVAFCFMILGACLIVPSIMNLFAGTMSMGVVLAAWILGGLLAAPWACFKRNPPDDLFTYKETLLLKGSRTKEIMFKNVQEAKRFETAVNTAIAAHI